MNPRLAFLISAVTSPFLVLPVFGLLVIAAESPTPHAGWLWGSLFLLVGILPAGYYIVRGVRAGTLTDLHVAEREQRGTPFALATLGSGILLALYLWLRAPVQLVALAACLGICGVILYAITSRWKISIHAAAYTGSVTFAGLLMGPQYLWFLLGIPLIFWARLTRNRHTLSQGVAASLVVSICVVATLRLALG